MTKRATIDKATIDSLMEDMVRWRGLANKNYTFAKKVQEAYVQGAEAAGLSITDAEARAAKDARFVVAVSNNQMYDRFATRDAAVLTAFANLKTAGLLEVRD